MSDKLIKESQCRACVNAHTLKATSRGCKIFGVRPKKYLQATSSEKCPYRNTIKP